MAASVKSLLVLLPTVITSAANGLSLPDARPLHDVLLVVMLLEKCQISSASGTEAELRGRAIASTTAEDMS